MANGYLAASASVGNHPEDPRMFLRHPADVPIRVGAKDAFGLVENTGNTKNVSGGGLCFMSDTVFPTGTLVHVQIPVVKPPFELDGKVAWCCRESDHFDVGMEFADKEQVFRARMIEQICQIEHYRREQEQLRGQPLDSESMAHEWISRHAAEFARASFI